MVRRPGRHAVVQVREVHGEATVVAPTAQDLLELFPPDTRQDSDGTLVVAGCRLDELAARFGTPLYVVDEDALRARARLMRAELGRVWAASTVTFASKAFPAVAAYRLMSEEGLGVDVAGHGELMLALAAGVPPRDILLHGNAKTDAELELAVRTGVGLVVVDGPDDLDRLERLTTADRPQRVLIRVVPGIVADTHAAMATGHEGSKFGVPLNQAPALIKRARLSDRLHLAGVHVHVGSQILDVATLAAAVGVLAGLGEFEVYDLGGGLGARYTVDERAPTVREWAEALGTAAHEHLPAGARVLVEPGRSLVAQAGVTVYRVVTVKSTPDRTFVAVDGGMGDNLDVSLYGQRYQATVVDRVGGGSRCELVGHHCESGDVLVHDAFLDRPAVGDLITTPVTGAYCYTMANNYNGALRPAVVFCSDAVAREVVARETFEDLLRRQRG